MPDRSPSHGSDLDVGRCLHWVVGLNVVVAFDDAATVAFEHSVVLGNIGLLEGSLHGDVVAGRRRWVPVEQGAAAEEAFLRMKDVDVALEDVIDDPCLALTADVVGSSQEVVMLENVWWHWQTGWRSGAARPWLGRAKAMEMYNRANDITMGTDRPMACCSPGMLVSRPQ